MIYKEKCDEDFKYIVKLPSYKKIGNLDYIYYDFFDIFDITPLQLRYIIYSLIKYVYDTVVVTQIEKEYIEKPVIVEVEKPIPYIPKIYKLAMIFAIGVIVFFGIRLFIKLKGGLVF